MIEKELKGAKVRQIVVAKFLEKALQDGAVEDLWKEIKNGPTPLQPARHLRRRTGSYIRRKRKPRSKGKWSVRKRRKKKGRKFNAVGERLSPCHHWLVKRFQMRSFWGCKIPFKRNDAGDSFFARQIKTTCVLEDQSYLVPMEFKGSEPEVRSHLQNWFSTEDIDSVLKEGVFSVELVEDGNKDKPARQWRVINCSGKITVWYHPGELRPPILEDAPWSLSEVCCLRLQGPLTGIVLLEAVPGLARSEEVMEALRLNQRPVLKRKKSKAPVELPIKRKVVNIRVEFDDIRNPEAPFVMVAKRPGGPRRKVRFKDPTIRPVKVSKIDIGPSLDEKKLVDSSSGHEGDVEMTEEVPSRRLIKEAQRKVLLPMTIVKNVDGFLVIVPRTRTMSLLKALVYAGARACPTPLL